MRLISAPSLFWPDLLGDSCMARTRRRTQACAHAFTHATHTRTHARTHARPAGSLRGAVFRNKWKRGTPPARECILKKACAKLGASGLGFGGFNKAGWQLKGGCFQEQVETGHPAGPARECILKKACAKNLAMALGQTAAFSH